MKKEHTATNYFEMIRGVIADPKPAEKTRNSLQCAGRLDR